MSREAGLRIDVVGLCGRDEGVHGRGGAGRPHLGLSASGNKTRDCLDSRPNAQLGLGVVQVKCDRMVRDAYDAANLPGRLALSGPIQTLDFPRRKRDTINLIAGTQLTLCMRMESRCYQGKYTRVPAYGASEGRTSFAGGKCDRGNSDAALVNRNGEAAANAKSGGLLEKLMRRLRICFWSETKAPLKGLVPANRLNNHRIEPMVLLLDVMRSPS